MSFDNQEQSTSSDLCVTDEFKKAYPYLAGEFAREDDRQLALGVFSDMAIREALRDLPNLRPSIARMGDSFLD